MKGRIKTKKEEGKERIYYERRERKEGGRTEN